MHKQSGIRSALVGTGIGGVLGGLLGRFTGYNAGNKEGYRSGSESGYNAGNKEGYRSGSESGGRDTLLNLLRGMTDVVDQGRRSDVDLKQLLMPLEGGASPAMSSVAVKTAKLRRMFARIEKQAIASLSRKLFGPDRYGA